MQSQSTPHHFRDDDVTFDLMDRQEQQYDPDRRNGIDDERVQKRRNRAEPGSQVWNELGDRDPRTKEQRVLLSVREPPEHAEQP